MKPPAITNHLTTLRGGTAAGGGGRSVRSGHTPRASRTNGLDLESARSILSRRSHSSTFRAAVETVASLAKCSGLPDTTASERADQRSAGLDSGRRPTALPEPSHLTRLVWGRPDMST